MGTYLGEADPGTDTLVAEAVKESIRSRAVNVIDTAINYRLQRAERSVGRALRELFESGEVARDEVFVATKNGYLTHDGELDLDFWTYLQKNLIKPGVMRPEEIAGGSHCMSVSYLRDQMNRSLRNLSIEAVDLMYIHNSAESQIPDVGREEYLARLEKAFAYFEEERERGRIHYYGMASWTCFRVSPEAQDYLSLEDIWKLAAGVGGNDHGFRFIQLPLNIAMAEALRLKNQGVGGAKMSTLEAASKLAIGVFCSIPLLQGQLASHRNVPVLPNLKTRAQTCIQFVRSIPYGVVAPLAGQKNPAHVKENLEVASVPPLGIEEFSKFFPGYM